MIISAKNTLNETIKTRRNIIMRVIMDAVSGGKFYVYFHNRNQVIVPTQSERQDLEDAGYKIIEDSAGILVSWNKNEST